MYCIFPRILQREDCAWVLLSAEILYTSFLYHFFILRFMQPWMHELLSYILWFFLFFSKWCVKWTLGYKVAFSGVNTKEKAVLQVLWESLAILPSLHLAHLFSQRHLKLQRKHFVFNFCPELNLFIYFIYSFTKGAVWISSPHPLL